MVGQRKTEHLQDRPWPLCETDGHGGRAGREELSQATPAARAGLIEFLTQGQVRPDEMIISAPPFEMKVEFAGQVGGAPRAAGEWGETAAQGEIEAFDEGGLDAAGQTEGL